MHAWHHCDLRPTCAENIILHSGTLDTNTLITIWISHLKARQAGNTSILETGEKTWKTIPTAIITDIQFLAYLNKLHENIYQNQFFLAYSSKLHSLAFI